MEIKLYSTHKSLLSLTVRPFVTNFRKFLFACNLDYWFLGASYFVFVDISDGDNGGSLCCDRSFIIGECFLISINVHHRCSYHRCRLLIDCDAERLGVYL